MTLSKILFSPKGRISRKTFWLATLGLLASWVVCLFALSLLLMIIELATTGKFSTQVKAPPFMGLLWMLWFIVSLWAMLMVQVKRFHDEGKTGWWVLANLIPIGIVWVVFDLGCNRGTAGPNAYGEDPLGGQPAARRSRPARPPQSPEKVRVLLTRLPRGRGGMAGWATP